jgi:FMN phosphatase YigB (HAD superfamily)
VSGRVILDCDGVLLNYTAGIHRFAARRLGLQLDPEGPCNFDMRAWTGLDREGVRDLVNAFNSGEDTGFDALPPMPGAVEGVRLLREAGYRLHVLSSADAGGASVRSRLHNLDRDFGDVFEEVTLIGLGASKRELLARFDPCDWVDDHVPNAIAGIEAGHRAHVIRQSHNRVLEAVTPHPLLWSEDLLEVHGRIRPEPSPGP